MSNRSLRYPSSLTPQARGASRRARMQIMRKVLRVTSRGWFTRRQSARTRRAKLRSLRSDERATMRMLGWLRPAQRKDVQS